MPGFRIARPPGQKAHLVFLGVLLPGGGLFLVDIDYWGILSIIHLCHPPATAVDTDADAAGVDTGANAAAVDTDAGAAAVDTDVNAAAVETDANAAAVDTDVNVAVVDTGANAAGCCPYWCLC